MQPLPIYYYCDTLDSISKFLGRQNSNVQFNTQCWLVSAGTELIGEMKVILGYEPNIIHVLSLNRPYIISHTAKSKVTKFEGSQLSIQREL